MTEASLAENAFVTFAKYEQFLKHMEIASSEWKDGTRSH